MKTRVLLTLMLLALFLSGAGMVGAEGLDNVARQPGGETPSCLGLRLIGEYDYEILADFSSLGKSGEVVVSVQCNYRMSTRASHPAGPGQISGMAITINYACPAQTESSWKSKTDNRDDAISRTSNSVLLRDTGEVTSFTGDHTVQEKMFLLIDSHTIATIVVNTDPLPGTTDSPIYSAVTAQPMATDLATLYAAQANDPQCGRPPIAGGSGTSSPGGTTQIERPGHDPWQYFPATTGVAVAVGTGAIVVLAVGGLVTGGGGIGLGSSVPAGSAGSAGSAGGARMPFEPAPASPMSTPTVPASTASMEPVSATGIQDTQGAGVGPPPAYTEPAATPIESTPPISPAVVEPAAAPPAPSIVQPVIEAAETVLAVGGVVAQAGSTTSSSADADGGDQSDSDEGDEAELEKRCPEAEAYLFGLPAINGRADCPGVRPGMGPWYAGLDFTSKDEHGVVTNLEFDACVSGVVTYVGGPFNMIEVKRENGNRVQFLHASEVYVAVGNEVEGNTKLGKTGGTGPEGANQYEIHLHVQAIDEQGNMIDPDCAISGGENRELKIKGSESPYRERIEHEQEADRIAQSEAATVAESAPSVEAVQAIPAVEAIPVEEVIPAVEVVEAVEEPDAPVAPAPTVEPEPESEAASLVEAMPVPEPTPAIEPEPAPEPIPAIEPSPAIVTSSNEPKKCGNCGQANPPTAKFCSSCGQRFAGG